MAQPSPPEREPPQPPARDHDPEPPPLPAARLTTGSSAALLPLILVGALIAWWAWKSGAYFDVILLPGTIVLFAVAIALLLFALLPGRFQGAARIALVALLGLAAWTLASALWSPTPEVAVVDSQRVLAYGLAFALGIWLCLLLGRGMLLALAPLAVAGAVVAVATLVALWVGDNAAEFFEEDATLRYPLGYRNAEAAFFGVALWPMLVLAAARDLDWRARGALLGAATLSIELAVLSQSRAALFAVVVAAAALVAVHPERLRMLGYMVLAAVPAALALPWLLDVFQQDAGETAASIPPLHRACAAMAVSSVVASILGVIVARTNPRLSPGAGRLVAVGLWAALALVLVAAVVGLARSDGGPAGFFEDHIDQLTAGTPDLSEEGSRFGLDLRSGRGDLWRVALDDFEANPVAGGGAGAFRSSYLLDRDSDATDVQPEDPHSVEFLMASELGIPGLALFATFIVAALVAALRARRLGPSAAALAAGALAAGAYWLLQASVDWFWHYPAITLPVAFALGAAAAPALLCAPGRPRRGWRLTLAAVCLIGALALLPFFLSERYTKRALQDERDDPAQAYSSLEKAADLNPLSARPLLYEAVVAEEAGEPQRALAALSEAQERTPTEWTLYYLEARILEEIDPVGARRAIAEARRLNPYGTELDALEARLEPGS
jgi:hypothetical protein